MDWAVESADSRKGVCAFSGGLSSMHVLLGLLIVAAAPKAPMEGRYPDATEVFHCAFDEPSDRDCDGWPDRWTRRRGPGFPHYVKIYIDTQRAPGGQRALRVDLDGGGAIAYSPPIPASSLYDYVLECLVQTEGLHYDSVGLSITFRDEQRQELETFALQPARDALSWKKLRLGPVSPRDPKVKTAVVGLHVQGSARADLKGYVLFSDVWLGRLPRMTLATGRDANLFTDPGQIAIDCRVSGLTTPAPTVNFELVDVSGKALARSAEPLRTKVALEGQDESGGSAWGEAAGLIGTAQWRPAVPGPGFYRVRATTAGDDAVVHRRELSLVVIEPRRRPADGEFGWSLPRGDRPLPLSVLEQWIAQAGVHWIKYPLWYGPNAPEAKVRETLDCIERLSLHGIETVGLLDRLPEDTPGGVAPGPPPSAAELFSLGREVWGPSLEATMLRLGGTIRWWQLGSDRDASFVGYSRLAEKIAQIKGEIDRVNYDVKLGLGWSRTAPVPEAAGGKAPWCFLALEADPPPSPGKLPPGRQAPKPPDVSRWVVVEPLPRTGHALSDRAAELVQRMLGAKIAGAEGIFIADPLGDERGLIHDDGTPGELFLPWRIAALTLGGSEPLGELALPGGSANRVFARPGDAVMIVWSPKPVEEPLGPGEDVRHVDLWGRSREVQARDDGLRIEVGPEPTFVTGLSGPVTRWQLGLKLLADRIPSVPGQRHRNAVDFANSFLQGVEGTLSLVAPEGWSVEPRRIDFRLAAGEVAHQPLEIVLPASASSGPQMLRADFEVRAERTWLFSAYRPVHVGLGDVRIEVASQLNGHGELEVQQRLVSETNHPVRFRCSLYAPQRRLVSTQVIVPGGGFDLKTYRLPDGKALVGKTLLLEARELGGPGVLNYRFQAEK
jgi:hypothetical protein